MLACSLSRPCCPQEHGVPVNCRIYANGGHGFGLGGANKPAHGQRPGLDYQRWTAHLEEWLQDGGWLATC